MENLIIIAIMITLIVVIALLMYFVYKQNEERKTEREEFKKERQDLMNRLFSKSTSDYRDMTKVTNPTSGDIPVQKKPVSNLDQQLMDAGALEYGSPNPYRGM